MNARILIMGVTIISLSVWVGFWFYNNYQWVNEKSYRGYEGEARTNPLLAVQRLVVALEGKAQSMRSMPKIPPQGVTLVMPTLRHTLSSDLAGKLLHWVATGNHLVVVAHNQYYSQDKQDALLDTLGVSEINVDDPDSTAETEPPPPQFDISGRGDFFKINLNSGSRLVSKQVPSWKVADNMGAYIVQIKHGQGKVTVLNNGDFMYSDVIGKYDNAVLMAYILQIQPDSNVWLVYSEEALPFLEWLTVYAWQVLMSGALLLMLGLWTASRRFGVLLPAPGTARRSLLEHIAAAGHFLWRHGGESALLVRMRTSVKRAVFLRYPRWASLSDEQLYHELAVLSGLSVQQIEKALDLPVYGNQYHFTHVIQTMEIIRRKL